MSHPRPRIGPPRPSFMIDEDADGNHFAQFDGERSTRLRNAETAVRPAELINQATSRGYSGELGEPMLSELMIASMVANALGGQIDFLSFEAASVLLLAMPGESRAGEQLVSCPEVEASPQLGLTHLTHLCGITIFCVFSSLAVLIRMRHPVASSYAIDIQTYFGRY